VSDPEHHHETYRAAAAIWKIESAKLIAVIARMVRDVDLAEEIAQDAFLDAIERWSKSGIPDSPGAWLMTAAKHRTIDVLRRARRVERKHDELARDVVTSTAADFDEASDDIVGDDLLRLVFVACHPVLSQEARVALTLRLLGGLSTDEIARAFLVPEPTIAQRITRAKRTLSEKKIPFELPQPTDVAVRLESVLEVIYLVFNEGYSATAGDDWMRPALCEDALRLGRILAELTHSEPEVHGLVALMEIQASRVRARIGPNGEAVLLLDQDRTQWDGLLIRRGFDALVRAEELVRDRPGPYLVQAAIAACHARAKVAADTDWARIAALYDALAQITPSPIVDLNRAVAHAMAFGSEIGLAIVDELVEEPSLRDYPFLPSVRADLLARLGRFGEAQREIERAVSLTQNGRERAKLLERGASYARGEVPRSYA
jgi:RNA polymerase sigma-70 factor, ECF subfamily